MKLIVAETIVASINEICTLKFELANQPKKFVFTKTFSINETKYNKINLIKCLKKSFFRLKVIFLFAPKEKIVPKIKLIIFAELKLNSKKIKAR